MKHKSALFLIGFLLLFAAVGQLIVMQYPQQPMGATMTSVGLGLAQLVALYVLVTNGTCLTTVYFKVILFFLGCLIIGSMFVLMHWPYGRHMMVGSSVGTGITYLIWFYQKPRKQRLDWLKLLWVLAVTGIGVSIFQHWIPRSLLPVPHLFFWLMVLDFAYQDYSNRYT